MNDILTVIAQSIESLKFITGDSRLLFVLAVGVTFAVLAISILYLLGRAVSPVRRRIQESASIDSDDASQPKNKTAAKIDRSVAPIKGLIVPNREKELSTTNKRLMHAGFRGAEVTTAFYAIKVLLAVVLAISAGGIAFVFFNTNTENTLYSLLGGAAAGLILPSYWLDNVIEKRQTEVMNAFPDVLDLMVACTEAGLGLNAAIQRVAKETTTIYPVLSAELAQVNSDIQSGVERTTALKGLTIRTGVEEISGFVSMISQSVKFGTSIADTLRVYAEEFRDKRMQRAEEKAAKVSTKLIFPLVLCIFPSFFAVAIGPAVIAIMRAFE